MGIPNRDDCSCEAMDSPGGVDLLDDVHHLLHLALEVLLLRGDPGQ